MYLTLMLLVVASGPLIYMVIAAVAKRADTYELYHYAGRRVPPSRTPRRYQLTTATGASCAPPGALQAARGKKPLEGIMNKIKVIKRMAYGIRDDEYFFLKIRAAFPGNPGWTKFLSHIRYSPY